MKSNSLSASQEDYLEAIYLLSKETGSARPKAIAEQMNVRAASVTGALRALKKKKLIQYEPYSAVTLTESGREIAILISGKHAALLHFFSQVLGIKEEEAEEFACTMEHSIPDHILERLICFAEYTEKCPNFSASWQDSPEGYFCRAESRDPLRCQTCQLANLK